MDAVAQTRRHLAMEESFWLCPHIAFLTELYKSYLYWFLPSFIAYNKLFVESSVVEHDEFD